MPHDVPFGSVVAARFVQPSASWWIAGTFVLTGAMWLMVLSVLLTVAKRVHDDIPEAFAVKLPLLQLGPELIFAGDSRTNHQVDPALAAALMGKPHGFSVNIAYEAGEPLALLAAIRLKPHRFQTADVVTNLTPPVLNDGLRTAGSNPQDVTARMTVFDQMTTFLPMRLGTLIRFIREAFKSRLAADQHLADVAPPPADLGFIRLAARPDYKWPAGISDHAFYAGWDLSGPKARLEIGALCDIVQRVRKLTVVFPPWAPRYDRNTEPAWRDMDNASVALVLAAGRRCGFDVLNLQSVPGLTQADFFDESHLNASGVPVYTRYLMSQIKR